MQCTTTTGMAHGLMQQPHLPWSPRGSPPWSWQGNLRAVI